MKITCPKNKRHTRFSVLIHEVHEWTINRQGERVRDEGCTEVEHDPEVGDRFVCNACGAEAEAVEDKEEEIA